MCPSLIPFRVLTVGVHEFGARCFSVEIRTPVSGSFLANKSGGASAPLSNADPPIDACRMDSLPRPLQVSKDSTPPLPVPSPPHGACGGEGEILSENRWSTNMPRLTALAARHSDSRVHCSNPELRQERNICRWPRPNDSRAPEERHICNSNPWLPELSAEMSEDQHSK